MIKIQVIGHLGKDCVVNTVNGKSVINFTVAHSEKFKDAQGVNQEKTTWCDCAYWTDRAAVAPYLVKGTLVYVEGNPEVKTFTRGDGSAGASLSIRVGKVDLLGSKKDSNSGTAGSYSSAPSSQAQPAGDDFSNVGDQPNEDLPF